MTMCVNKYGAAFSISLSEDDMIILELMVVDSIFYLVVARLTNIMTALKCEKLTKF